MADAMAAAQRRTADRDRHRADYQPDARQGPQFHAGGRWPGLGRPGDGDARGTGAVGTVLASRAWSAFVLSACCAAVVLAAIVWGVG